MDRTMFAEWNRVLSHLMFMGSYPLELGAMTPIFYAFIEREMIQALMESATGARMHFSYIRPGGLKDDLPHGFLKQSAEVLKHVRKKLQDLENLVMGNEIVHARTKNVGILPRETAIAYGCSGPVLQASGVPMDPRKDEPYEITRGRVPGEVSRGDSYDRLWVLAQRMHQSCNIIEQCMEKLPAGDYVAPKLPKTIKLDGEVYVRTENPLGLMGYYVIGDGKPEPYRMKMRTASFSNVSSCGDVAGNAGPDLIAISVGLLRRQRRRPITAPRPIGTPCTVVRNRAGLAAISRYLGRGGTQDGQQVASYVKAVRTLPSEADQVFTAMFEAFAELTVTRSSVSESPDVMMLRHSPMWMGTAAPFEAPRPTRVLPVRLPPELHERLRSWSAEQGFSMAAVVRGLVERFLEDQGKPARPAKRSRSSGPRSKRATSGG
jgi:hypothetical protein